MMYVRPVELSDIDGLVALYSHAGDRIQGMTTIRPERHFVGPRVERARQAWENAAPMPAENDYLFVLVDSETETVLGSSTVFSAVGLTEPFYSYRVGTTVAASRELGVYRNTHTLYLSNDYTGVAEVASLYLHEDHVGGGHGRLLSLSRMLFMAQHPDRFPERVMAEMRGFQNEDGSSPFWEGLGRHFFTLPFPEADRLSASGNRTFIGDLMPRHPIYVPLLPAEARAVIGEVHPSTIPARRLLESEGFRYQGYVDIFDGGASLDARIMDLRAVQQSAIETIAAVDHAPLGPDPLLIATTGVTSFRCITTDHYGLNHGLLQVEPAVLTTLGINSHTEVRVTPLRPGRTVL